MTVLDFTQDAHPMGNTKPKLIPPFNLGRTWDTYRLDTFPTQAEALDVLLNDVLDTKYLPKWLNRKKNKNMDQTELKMRKDVLRFVLDYHGINIESLSDSDVESIASMLS